MKKIIAFSLIAAVTASTSSNDELPLQAPLLPDACPLGSILANGECHLSSNAQSPVITSNSTRPVFKSRHNPKDVAELPWSFWPECYRNATTAEPVCVFSHQGFASGRGIFVVSTPTRAHKMLRKLAFTDAKSLEGINNHESPPYALQELTGRGRGLIANRTLYRGDQIFASTPLVLSDSDAYNLVRLALFKRGVDQLPPSSQALFWSLLGHFKGDPIDGRINTNAFEVEVDDNTQYAVLPEIAMLNHDCRPNAVYFWDEETLTHYVHAVTTIYPGEEITITYINNEQERTKRMDALKESWGFECSCSSCVAHPAFVNESDARIKQIDSLSSRLEDWREESDATPEMAEALISLYKQERLTSGLGAAYRQAAETYASFGDKWNAVKYARLSVEYSMLDKGFRDGAVKEMMDMAAEPELAWSWKKRSGAAKAGTGPIL